MRKQRAKLALLICKKTFDTLDHDLLLKKILDFGFIGKIFEILEDYLSDPRQYISHNGVCTEKFNIVSCVPQGSVLAPFLFLLYIDDIHLCMGKTVPWPCLQMIHLFQVRNAKVLVQFNQIWTIYRSGKNRLSINRDKCEAVEFGHGHPSEILILDKKCPIRTRASI